MDKALCVAVTALSAFAARPLVDVVIHGGYTGQSMAAPPRERRFVIVPAQPRKTPLFIAGGIVWLVSVVGAWLAAERIATPELRQTRVEARQQVRDLEAARTELTALRQRVATLARSDEISRRANSQLQSDLSEREEEIAQLRSDVAFYERLVGTSGERRGLSVHTVQMRPAASGVWDYTVTLTQNLNRGAMTTGSLRLQVEGVREGRMVMLDWDELTPADAGAQPFSFRYFQQLEGSVLLPDGFSPQRVRVQLRSDAGNTQHAVSWETATGNAATTVGE